jgi:hypothetical protein
MKKINVLLLVVVFVSLIAGCKNEKKTEGSLEQINSSPTTSVASSSPQTSIAATANLFISYQNSQSKVIDLLKQRIDNRDNSSELKRVKQQLKDELATLKGSIKSLLDSSSNSSAQENLRELDTLFSFKDLSKESDVKALQEKLNISNLGDEEGKFGIKTNEALVKRTNSIKEELTSKFEKSPSPKTNDIAKPVTKESDSSGLSWRNALLSLILSMIGSGGAIYFALNQKKQILDKDLANLHSYFTLKINTLNADIKRTRDESKQMSDQVNELSRLVNISGKNSSSPVSSMVTQSTDSYKYDIGNRASINPALKASKKSFVDDYNQNGQDFVAMYNIEEVLEEERNIEGRRSGLVKTVYLIQARRHSGLYWVFSQDGLCRLVPSSTMKFNKNQEFVISAVFNYPEFRSRYQRIRLIESAIVQPTSNGYELVHKGRIEFE